MYMTTRYGIYYYSKDHTQLKKTAENLTCRNENNTDTCQMAQLMNYYVTTTETIDKECYKKPDNNYKHVYKLHTEQTGLG